MLRTESQTTTTPDARTASPNGTTLAYSPALDGLRAVAVAAVLLYHLSLPWVRGGFLGVDLFFVLSGFLITSLLVREYRAGGSIRLGTFWARRVRRLLPASLLVIVAVCVWSALAQPSDLIWSVRHDALWTLGYAANWHFVLSGQSYFAQFNQPSPLLHTWSLAIEEQFYLVWPLLVLVLLRWWRGRLWPLTAVALVGAACSAALMRHLYQGADPSRVYYGTDTRAHELLAGAVLALLVAGPLGDRLLPWLRRLAVPAGLAVLVAMVVVPDSWPWYYRGGGLVFGFVAAVLVSGTWAGGPAGTPLARLLGLRPAAWLGRISYGLYLWHWPVYQALNESSGLHGAALDAARVAASLLIAVASFYLVEQPIRRGRPFGLRLSPRRLVVVAPVTIGVAVVLVLGTTAGATKPLLTDDASQLRALVDPPRPGAYTVGFAGDSVARLTAPGVAGIAQRSGWGLVSAAFDGCSVGGFEQVDAQDNIGANPCPSEVPAAQRGLVDQYNPSVIFVYSRWDEQPAYGPDHRALMAGTAAQEKVVEAHWRGALTRLTSRGATVVWIDLMPAGPELCQRAGGPDTDICRASHAVNALQPTYNALFRKVAKGFGGKVLTISVRDLLCADPACTADKPGAPLRVDGLHFDAPNATRFAPLLLERARRAGAPIPAYQP